MLPACGRYRLRTPDSHPLEPELRLIIAHHQTTPQKARPRVQVEVQSQSACGAFRFGKFLFFLYFPLLSEPRRRVAKILPRLASDPARSCSRCPDRPVRERIQAPAPGVRIVAVRTTFGKGMVRPSMTPHDPFRRVCPIILLCLSCGRHVRHCLARIPVPRMRMPSTHSPPTRRRAYRTLTPRRAPRRAQSHRTRQSMAGLRGRHPAHAEALSRSGVSARAGRRKERWAARSKV